MTGARDEDNEELEGISMVKMGPSKSIDSISSLQDSGHDGDSEDRLLMDDEPSDTELLAVGDETELFALHNVAIPVFYFLLGFLLKFPYVAVRQYLRLELEEPPAIQILVFVVMTLPWNFKMVYGFISDCFPIRGMRRKPYMLMGAILCASCWTLMGILHRPTVSLTCFILFWAAFGMVYCDVMADTLVVERMKHERGTQVGDMQSMCWIMRFGGSLVGYLGSGWLMHYAKLSPQSIFLANGLFPISLLLPALYWLRDPEYRPAGSGKRGPSSAREEMRQKLEDIWGAVQQNHIWQPMIFVFLFAVTPGNSDGFANFILGPLEFSEAQYTYVLTVGVFSSAVGAWVYRTFLKAVGWRRLFTVTLVVTACVSATQLLLIFRINSCWGVSDFAFAFGDEVVMDVAGFILGMPMLIMCAKLCPPGVESTVYALTTVVNNVAGTISGSIESGLTSYYGISLTNFSNLWKLSVIGSATSLLPLLGVRFVPNRPEEICASNRSRAGGAVLLGLLATGLLWSVVNATYRISTSTGDQIFDSEDEAAVGINNSNNGTLISDQQDHQWIYGPVYNCQTGGWD